MIINLSEFDLLAIEGVDAAKFLQGQLTCNVEAATPTHSIRGAYCNLSGRIVSDMRLIPYEHGLYLLCQAGMAQVLKAALDKYIVFSKADTKIVTEQFSRFALFGDGLDEQFAKLGIDMPAEQGDIVPIPQGFVYRLESVQPCFELLLKQDQSTLHSTVQNMAVDTERSEWDLAQLMSAIVNITPAMQSEYTPQVLNYDLLGLVDFKKGCYTGQEIIARMHYRGKAKKRLYLAQAPDFEISTYTQLRVAEDTSGQIINFANRTDGHGFLLAILPCDAIEKELPMLVSNEDGTSQEISILATPGLQ